MPAPVQGGVVVAVRTNWKHHHNKPKECKAYCPDCSSHLYRGKVCLCARCFKKWHSKEFETIQTQFLTNKPRTHKTNK